MDKSYCFRLKENVNKKRIIKQKEITRYKYTKISNNDDILLQRIWYTATIMYLFIFSAAK